MRTDNIASGGRYSGARADLGRPDDRKRPPVPEELPKTLPYHIAERIQHGIIRGKYPLGSNLRETELGAEYGSSRGPIREGLRILELRGLVVHSPRRGFRVKSYTKEELDHLYRMRAQLESVVIDALSRFDNVELANALRDVNEAMKRACSENDLDRYFDLNVKFHQLMIDACNSSTLSRVLSMVNDMSVPIRYLLVKRDFPKTNDYEYHGKIVEAIERNDYAFAHELISRHVLKNIPNVMDIFDKMNPELEEARR